MRSFFSVVLEAKSQSKTNHTMRKGKKMSSPKLGLFLGSILFDVTWAFGNMYSPVPITRHGSINWNSSFIRVHISAVTKCVTKFLTLSQWGLFDSVKNFVTPEIWILGYKTVYFIDLCCLLCIRVEAFSIF